MTRELLAFYITFPNKDIAKKICDELISKKLIACSNILDIESAYWWKSEVQHEDEVLALIKTSSHLKEEIISQIEHTHPYEVPCIVHWPVQANKSYRNWVFESVKD